MSVPFLARYVHSDTLARNLNISFDDRSEILQNQPQRITRSSDVPENNKNQKKQVRQTESNATKVAVDKRKRQLTLQIYSAVNHLWQAAVEHINLNSIRICDGKINNEHLESFAFERVDLRSKDYNAEQVNDHSRIIHTHSSFNRDLISNKNTIRIF